MSHDKKTEDHKKPEPKKVEKTTDKIRDGVVVGGDEKNKGKGKHK